jgi:hypothetical protein
VRKHLLAFAFAAIVAAGFGTAQADAIRIDVGAQPTGNGVPPVMEFGGGVWRIPKVMPWVAPSILDLRTGGGTYRAALSWEVLAASSDFNDLKARLNSYRLNDFLKQVKAKGAKIIISLDGMPKWLAQDKSETKMADGPAWAKSVPSSAEQWSAIVQAVVQHFNGELGLDAYYEVWNEPDWSLRGSVDQYLNLYKETVIGAKQADPKARIIGPALSDWMSPGKNKPFFLQSFFDYAARTPAPEVGLDRLPIDAVTWHSFYRDHATSYALAAKTIRGWLQQAGYPQQTPLILDEWNIASAEPPYPEGDINGGYSGAVYVAATLMAMNEAKIDRQTYQMMVDPGAQGYSGGAFTAAGAPRPSFNAFRMFAWLKGQALTVQSTQKWVRSVAFADGKHVYLIVAVAPPSDFMLGRGIVEALPIENPGAYEEMKKVKKEALAAFLLKNGSLPGGLSSDTTAALQKAREQLTQDRQERDSFKSGVTIQIALDPALGIKSNSLHAVFDRKHAPDAGEMDRATQDLTSVLKKSLEKAQQELNSAEVAPELKQKYLQALKDNFDASAVIGSADPTGQAALKRADQALTQDFSARLATLDKAGLKRLTVDPVAIQNSMIELQSEGIALHYFVLDR